MKRIIPALALSLFMSCTLIACTWFGKKSPAAAPLIGSWRLDSVVAPHDSTANPVASMIIALAVGDSTPLVLTFTQDSIYTRSHDSLIEKAAYRFHDPYITSLDSAGETSTILQRSDSAMILQSKDSSRMFLTRQ